MPMTDKDLIETYRDIDGIFENIRDIADTYLSIEYPEAPDPDDFIDAVEDQIKRYREITK